MYYAYETLDIIQSNGVFTYLDSRNVEYECIMAVFTQSLLDSHSLGYLCKYHKGQLPKVSHYIK